MKRIMLLLALSFVLSIFCVSVEAAVASNTHKTEMTKSQKKTQKILKKRKQAYQKQVAARRCTRSTKELR